VGASTSHNTMGLHGPLRDSVSIFNFKISILYIHITRYLKASDHSTVELVKYTEWAPNYTD
jgi:hypothetical protein